MKFLRNSKKTQKTPDQIYTVLHGISEKAYALHFLSYLYALPLKKTHQTAHHYAL